MNVKQIIQEILDGNQNAFTSIIDKYSEQLMKIAYQYFHDYDKAKEITHETFIKVYKNIKSFNINKSFAPWIYKIHLNNCRSNYRKQKILSLFDSDGMIDNISSRESTSSYQDIEDIMSCVDRLPWKQKTAFILMELEEKPSGEAGLIMNCKDNTARVHLNRAKQKLRKMLKKLDY